jgi:hypothetical protein
MLSTHHDEIVKKIKLTTKKTIFFKVSSEAWFLNPARFKVQVLGFDRVTGF